MSLSKITKMLGLAPKFFSASAANFGVIAGVVHSNYGMNQPLWPMQTNFSPPFLVAPKML